MGRIDRVRRRLDEKRAEENERNRQIRLNEMLIAAWEHSPKQSLYCSPGKSPLPSCSVLPVSINARSKSESNPESEERTQFTTCPPRTYGSKIIPPTTTRFPSQRTRCATAVDETHLGPTSKPLPSSPSSHYNPPPETKYSCTAPQGGNSGGRKRYPPKQKKQSRKPLSKSYRFPSPQYCIDSCRMCDICGEHKTSNFRPVISDWIGKQRLLPDALRVMSCNPCYCRSPKSRTPPRRLTTVIQNTILVGMK